MEIDLESFLESLYGLRRAADTRGNGSEREFALG